jgi:hypothetical protein
MLAIGPVLKFLDFALVHNSREALNHHRQELDRLILLHKIVSRLKVVIEVTQCIVHLCETFTDFVLVKLIGIKVNFHLFKPFGI